MQNITNTEFLNRLQAKHGTKIEALTEYRSAREKITFKCNICGHISIRTSGSILRGEHCLRCTQLRKNKEKEQSLSEFLMRLESIHPNKLTLISPYINIRTKISVKCNDCGRIRTASPLDILRTHYCTCHSNKLMSKLKSKTHEYFVNELHEINPLIKVIGKYVNKRTKISVQCLTCQHEWDVMPNLLITSKNGCPICKVSKGERSVYNYLIKNNIQFEPQKTFDDLIYRNNLKLDFYLPELNIVIEVDGEQHRMPVKQFGGQKTFEYIQILDAVKNEYCKTNGINMIRLQYDYRQMPKLLKQLEEILPLLI
jgi:very-short-patch-repair endonuclease